MSGIILGALNYVHVAVYVFLPTVRHDLAQETVAKGIKTRFQNPGFGNIKQTYQYQALEDMQVDPPAQVTAFSHTFVRVIDS